MKHKNKYLVLIILCLIGVKIFAAGILFKEEGFSFEENFLGIAIAELRGDQDDSFDLKMEMLKTIEKKKKELEQKEQEIKMKEERLSLIEKSIQGRVEELDKVKRAIDKLIIKKDELEESSIQHLAKIYKGMAPQTAAQQMGKLDHDVALKVFTRMKSRTASKIMPYLAPKLAKQLGEEIVVKRLIQDEKKKKKR